MRKLLLLLMLLLLVMLQLSLPFLLADPIMASCLVRPSPRGDNNLG
jgi:hypothetical protein